MSPSIFREKGYRFYFLSNEEERIHIHVTCEDGEAHNHEIIQAWQNYFRKR